MSLLKVRRPSSRPQGKGLAPCAAAGKIEQGLDKVAKPADKKTKGTYSDKIQTGTSRAKGALERLAHKESDGTDGGVTPPPPAPPPPSAS